jgi:hypothetical protein
MYPIGRWLYEPGPLGWRQKFGKHQDFDGVCAQETRIGYSSDVREIMNL